MVSCLSSPQAHWCAQLRCLHSLQAESSGPACFRGARDKCTCSCSANAPFRMAAFVSRLWTFTGLLGARLQGGAAMRRHPAASAGSESLQAMAASPGDHALHPHPTALYMGSLGNCFHFEAFLGRPEQMMYQIAQQGDVGGNRLTWRRGAGNALALRACHCPLWTVPKHPRGHHGASSAP